MDSDQQVWRSWANTLQQWGVDQWAASLLEVAGPLTILAAQAFYVGQPFLQNALPTNQLDALIRLLEDTKRSQAFANFLREVPAR